MATLVEAYELDGVSIGSTAYSIPNASTTPASITTDGIYHLWVDPVQGGAMTKGDYFEAVVMEKCLSGSTQRKAFSAIIGNAQAEPWILPPLMLMHGWDMLIDKIAGTDRAFDASIRGSNNAITQVYSQSAISIDGTEISIIGGLVGGPQSITDDGIYQLWIDPVAAAMAKGDEFAIRIYEKVEGTGGTKRQVFKATLMDVQSQLFVSPMFQLMNGWDMTIQRISGTARSFDASIRRVG
jgi:hypothetical protein